MEDKGPEATALASHFAARDALISKELSLRSDTAFRNALSPIASQACAIVSHIREAEHASIWKHDPSNPDNEEGIELYPGMMFGLAKRKLESTHLWRIAKRMPKGTLLHCHLGAMVEVDWLFERILAVEGMHVCSSEALDTEAARVRAVVLFKYITPKPGSSHVSIWSSEYQPDTYVPAAEAADAFPSTGRQGFDVPDTGFNYRVAVMGEEIEAFKKTEEGKNFWGGRLIWTVLRVLDADSIVTSMKDCLEAKQAYPHLVAGFDLVGQEDLGQTLAALMPQILWFRQQCISQNLNIPFFFHAGECLGDGDSTDRNLYDAILLNTRRIGHAFSLFKHPHLIDIVKERRIMVESCPISNEVLRLTATALAHPLPALLARGVSASLSNDDPALLGQGTSGMSHDFWQAVQAWENLGLAGLGSLAENSVRYAAFEDEDDEQWVGGIDKGYEGGGVKAERMKLWRQEWEAFCQWIIDEYGAEFAK
ncbi:adenosine deaminase [Trichophyton rubrum]|uniref:adenosine deaminase n=1 Tax=Trichophyton rubrum TaxID=5551 RepID=A0A178F0G7_TRIRU|nr:adenosine deaminase [Trichophyton rubrum]